MNKYAIYCTEAQTRRALKLGAPIQYASIKDIGLERYVYIGDEWYTFPTAEEMIGWLEEKLRIISFDIVHYPRCGYGFSLMYENGIIEHLHSEDCLLYRSRADVTLAAIDAALEYLGNQIQ